MKIATVRLRSISPYSQSRQLFDVPKKDGESWDDFERRTWREKCHVNPAGNVVIPPMCFKWALDAASKYRGEKIPGKGAKTWSKKFAAGLLCADPVVLPTRKDDVRGEWISANSDGRRGSGTRVPRCFPMIDSWDGTLTVAILDPEITEPVFRRHMETAGQFIGIGRFRPENGGYLGRFEVVSLDVKEQ